MHLYKPSYKQGKKKVMCWVGLVNGKILPIHWFEEDGQPVSVNGDKYLDLLVETVWPAVRIPTAGKKLWFQQDGAPCHCTNRALAILNEKFKSRLTVAYT